MTSIDQRQTKSAGDMIKGTSEHMRAVQSSGVMRRVAIALSPKRIGAVYIILLLVIAFSFYDANAFLSTATLRGILSQSSVTGIVALGLVLPLAAGMFDLSVASTVSLSAVLGAKLLTTTALPIPVVILICLSAGLAVGLVNAVVVILLNIESLIGTLATGSIIGAAAIGFSGNKIITGPRVSADFREAFLGHELWGINIAFFYLIALMLLIGLWHANTATGRRCDAVGFSSETARLAGVSVNRVRLLTLVASGVIASFAGLVLLGRISSGDPGAGDPYLLTAFAAVFLGATQFKVGRFNAWGTVLAVLLVTTATYGLVLTPAPQWVPKVFNGVILIAAVAVNAAAEGDASTPLKRVWKRIRMVTDSTAAPDEEVSRAR